MNLDLGILWIEDSYDRDEEESLKRRVRDAGFIARIDVITNGTNIDELARKHALYHNYDIILLDYHLQDEKGDELAPKVRKLFPSVTILFYSGSVHENQLRQMVASKQVEGVYCVRRDHQRFIERAGELIDQTARALDRLSGMRGLAMRVVAECDDIMQKAILWMCEHDKKCAEKVTELDKDVTDSMEELGTKYQLAVSESLRSRLGTRAVDSAKLYKHFRRLTKVAAATPDTFGLDREQADRLRELRRISAQYSDNVLGKRNILGHAVEVQGESGWVLEGSGEISVEDFPEIRRIFATNIDAVREMSGLILLLDAKQAD